MKTKKSIIAAAFALSILSQVPYAQAAMQDEFSSSVVQTTDSAIMGSSAIFPYGAERQYDVDTQMGYITDIQLHAGEKITYVGAGDTKRWMIDTATVANVPHLYVKPLEEGITTNLIVNTDSRVYRLIIHSTNHYVPTVEWSYSEDFAAAKAAAEAAEKKQNDDILKHITTRYNYTYKVDDTKNKNWIPEKIYDDGVRTYISIPKNSENDLPTIQILDGKKSSLVNYRVLDGMFVVDRVFKKAILFFNNTQTITIVNTKEDGNQ